MPERTVPKHAPEVARAKLIKRLAESYARMVASRECPEGQSEDFVEQRDVETMVRAYLDEVPGGQADFGDLKQLALRCAIDPQHVMTYAKSLLLPPEDQEEDR